MTNPGSLRRELVHLLGGYTPSIAEVEAREQMLGLVQSPRDVLSSEMFDPGHFTVSGFVTDPAIEQVILILHRRVGAWLQPGGHLESGDGSIAAGLRREIVEETGLHQVLPNDPPVFDLDVHRVPAHRGKPPHQHFDVRFHLIADFGRLAPTDEVADAAWVPLDDVHDWTEDASVRRAVRKLGALRRNPA